MDLDKFLAMVRASQLQRQFFHFTDKKNLNSIRQHGLLSTAELRRRGLFDAVKPGNVWPLLAALTGLAIEKRHRLARSDVHYFVPHCFHELSQGSGTQVG